MSSVSTLTAQMPASNASPRNAPPRYFRLLRVSYDKAVDPQLLALQLALPAPLPVEERLNYGFYFVIFYDGNSPEGIPKTSYSLVFKNGPGHQQIESGRCRENTLLPSRPVRLMGWSVCAKFWLFELEEVNPSEVLS